MECDYRFIYLLIYIRGLKIQFKIFVREKSLGFSYINEISDIFDQQI